MTNQIVEQDFEMLDMTLALRSQLLDLLSDEDLTFQLPSNRSLGEQCREMAEVEHWYIESFRTFKQDYSYTAPNRAELETQVSALRETFGAQEEELKSVLAALSDKTIENQVIDRGGFHPPLRIHLHIYREALLIFYAKVSLYLRALGKELPVTWKQWIG